MQPPSDLSIESNKVCHLWRALYSLKQAPQAWFAKFNSTISHLGYMASHYDFALFLCRIDKGIILLLLYMDDMIITSDDLRAFKNSRIFSVSSLRWKILDILATSWVLKSLILQMTFILLKPSIPLNSFLELDSLIVRLLTLQLNLMHIWLPQEKNHCLIPLFTDAWLAT